MPVLHETIIFPTRGRGTYEITDKVAALINASGLTSGIVSVLCQHTSCSLVLMENADPSARRDLERFMDRLVPDDLPYFTHTSEGPDDMPSHIKMALTRSSETLPFNEKHLLLGTWQGLFLWEHRDHPHTRKMIVTIIGE